MFLTCTVVFLTMTAVLSSLPRGPHDLGREAVRASQRGRMLQGMTAAVAEKVLRDTPARWTTSD